MTELELTYRFRLYPKPQQETRMSKTLEVCRQVYNYFLSQWQGKEKIPSRYQLQSQLPKLKTDNTELKRVHSKVLQMVLHQLYSNLRSLTALKKKGRKVG